MKTNYSANYTFSETFKDASSTHQIFMLLVLRSCQKRIFIPVCPPPLPVSDAGNKTQGIHKVKQHDTANFSEVAALPAQDMLHQEILICDSDSIISWNCIGSEVKNCMCSHLLV